MKVKTPDKSLLNPKSTYDLYALREGNIPSKERKIDDQLKLTKTQQILVSMLKPGHLAFANKVSMGMNQTTAYRAVYPTVSYQSAKASSSKLLTNPNISDYIQELKKTNTRNTMYDRHWKRIKLIEIAERGMQLKVRAATTAGNEIEAICEYNPHAVIQAIREMNKMDGDYANPKTSINEETHAERIRRLDQMYPRNILADRVIEYQ